MSLPKGRFAVANDVKLDGRTRARPSVGAMRVFGVPASLREASYNRRLLRTAAGLPSPEAQLMNG